MKRYLGSELQHTDQRMAWYLTNGGAKSQRIIVEPAHRDRRQFHHPMANHDKSDIRTVKTNNAQYDLPGGYSRYYPSRELLDTTGGIISTFGIPNYFSMETDPLVCYAECTGQRFIVHDSVTKPRAENFQYHKHKLYAHNFPWIKEPVTNHQYGDADYNWKGTETIDYSSCGASTKDPRNNFRSLWRDAAEKYADAPATDGKAVQSPALVPAAASKEKVKTSEAKPETAKGIDATRSNEASKNSATKPADPSLTRPASNSKDGDDM